MRRPASRACGIRRACGMACRPKAMSCTGQVRDQGPEWWGMMMVGIPVEHDDLL